ncbi:MAG TPA: HutD family protein [Rubrivivax sp.]|nr:HutD family protein [Rubrivivax sp.]
MMRTLALSHAVEQTWRNGGGSTRELLAWPEAGHWSLRISVAAIARDGPFSAFAGVQRWMAVLRGDGVLLHLGDSPTTLTSDDPPLLFDGASAPVCQLLGSPTQDLNLMWRPDAGSGRMARAAADEEWSSRAPVRAVYTLDPVWLQIDDSDALAIDAESLAWHEDAATQRWRLRATGDATVRAWWMEFTPCPR